MKHQLSLLLTATFIALPPVAAQGSILPYLPKDTVLAVSVPDLSVSMNEFSQMPLAKMWAEEEVQNFLGDVKEMVAKEYQEAMAQAKEMHAQGGLPVDPEKLLDLRLQGGVLAVTHLEMVQGERGLRPKFGFIVHLDFGSTAPQWHQLLQVGLAALEGQAGDAMTKSEVKVGESTILSMVPTEANGVEMGLNLAMIPGGLLVGTLVDDVKLVLDGMQKRIPALGATAAYQSTAKQLDTQGAECEMFAQMDPVVGFALDGLRLLTKMNERMGAVDVDGVVRAIQAMGMDKLGSSGATSSYVNGKCVTRGFHAATAATTGTAAVKSIDTAFLKWVPKDAVGFSAATLDVMSIYDTLAKGLRAYDEKFAEQAMGALAKTEEQLGFKVREDFFGAFGDHYISWSMPMGNITSAPEMAFLVKVNDEERLVKVLKNLAKLTQGMVEIEEGEKRGLKAYQVRINYDPTQGMGGMNFLEAISPTFAFKNGYMVAGFSASDVKRVFQRMDREDDPKGDIRGNKEFAAVAADMPAGLGSVSFTDWKAQFESFYQIATGVLAFVPMGEEVPIDMSLLPDAGTLTKHLFGSLSYSTSDAAGSRSYSVSPFGPEVGLMAAGGVIAGVAVVGSMQRGF